MAIALTPRQTQILDFIRRVILSTGFPPTRAEISTEFGFKSANAAEEHLRALAKKNVIVLTAGASRGIRLVTTEYQDEAPSVLSRTTNFLGLTLPIVGRVAAGYPILATENVERELQVDPALFSKTPDYLLKVRGLSMRDAGILDGDLLAVKRTPEARSGQIVVARIDDDVTVKRLSQSKGHIVLLPENPDFEPISILPGQNFAIEGIAVGLIRSEPLH
jgi:repressor LexA